MRRIIVAICLTALTAGSVAASQEFTIVRDQARFVDLVSGKDLKRFGIRLTVTPDGAIRGRAFGRPVTGNWRWSEGYFCRDLFYGERDLGPNCQQVAVNGQTIRFTSDRGQGIFADLTLD